VFDEFPWLREFYPEKIPAGGSGGGGGGGGGGAGAAIEGLPPARVDLSDADVEAGWALLEERRLAWDEAVDRREGEGDAFYTFIRGGKTPMDRGHGSYDCIVAQARGFLPKYFCREYGLGIMYSFSFRMYGEVAACTLAVEVCRRLQHFYEIYTESDRDPHIFTQGEFDSYTETIEWCDFLLGLDIMHPAWVRGSDVRKLVPINKP
jgi:hypothetical protein